MATKQQADTGSGEEDHFDTSARVVVLDIVASTVMHSPSADEIRGKMCLGPSFKNDDGKKVIGIGLDAFRITALCNRLSVSLSQLGSKKSFPCKKLGLKVTVEDVVNVFDPLWK